MERYHATTLPSWKERRRLRWYEYDRGSMLASLLRGLNPKASGLQKMALVAFLAISMFALCASLLAAHLTSWRDVALVVLSSVVFGVAAAHVATTRWRSAQPYVPRRTHAALILAAVLSGYVSTGAPAAHEAAGIVWVKDVGAFAGQHVPVVEREAWGSGRRSIEIHATVNDDPQWLWRVSGDLPRDLGHLGGRITFFVTQPEWAVLGPDGNALPGDGVQLRWLAGGSGGVTTLTRLNLTPFANPDHRRWHEVSVALPPGVARMTLEALPGATGSTNWNDRLLIGTARVDTALDLLVRPAKALLLMLGLYFAGVLVYLIIATHQPTIGLVPHAVAVGVLLWILLAVVRLATYGVPRLSCSNAASCTASFIAAARHDSVYVGLVTSVAAATVWLVRKRIWAQQVVMGLLVVVAFISLCMGVISLEMSRTLGGPFTYQWLYYSDFLAGHTARASLLAYVTPASIATSALAVAGFAAAVALTRSTAARWASVRPAAFVSLTAVVGIAAALGPSWDQRGAETASFNPVMSFVESVVMPMDGARLFTMDTGMDAADFERLAEADAQPPYAPAPAQGIRNVIFYILESVAAEYVLNETTAATVVPELTRYRKWAATFPQIYAHAPASNKSLVSILASTYPLISYRSLTQVAPDAPLESISNVLRARGYRTGFFSSGDTRFQRGLDFLAHQGVDTRISYGDMACERERFHNSTSEWLHQDSFDDRCVLEHFMQWDALQTDTPFFAVLWPVQTHHPYSVVGGQANFGVQSEDFNRYLNALRQTDEVFGELMRHLETTGLVDSTLVVVVGDHGEAFGQHDQWVHASAIYDENVRVPLLLINPRRFSGHTEQTVGGLVDVAPTVMDILGLASPGSWQGRSLFIPQRSGRTYFFSPYAKVLFGLREDNLKLIVNATANSYEVYDLATDPYERHNVADRLPQFVRSGEERMAAWVKYQAALYDRILKP